MKWTRQQERALSEISEWLRDRNAAQCFLLFGFAGVGKTEIAHALHVLRQRGCDPTSTAHRLMYRYEYDQNGFRIPVLKTREELGNIQLLIVDEASMISEELALDLMSFGIKLLVIADPMQLPPPTGGKGFFMRYDPTVMLTEVHRQALNSPILRLATDVRNREPLWKKGRYDGALLITDAIYSRDGAFDWNVVLTGTHDTRHYWNRKRRIDWGFLQASAKFREPQVGETLVCKRNDYRVGDEVFNGQNWTVDSIEQDTLDRRNADPIPIFNLSLRNDDGETQVRVRASCFNGTDRALLPEALEKQARVDWQHGLQTFDFGYAITTHSAQGSAWDKVLLINESRCFPDQSREWLYTAITRASEKLTIINGN